MPMHSRLLIIAGCLAQMVWPDPVADTVRVSYRDSRGQTHDASARVMSDLDSGPGSPAHVLRFVGQDGIERSARVSQALLASYRQLSTYYQDHPGRALAVPRSTGGNSAANVQRPYLMIPHLGVGRAATEVGVIAELLDYERLGGPHGDPALGPRGRFETQRYVKRVPFKNWEGGIPRFGGGAHEFSFPANPDPDPRQQRYLLDFGRHPFQADRQLLHPVYVDRFEGSDAVVINPLDLQLLEKARAGEKVKLAYWVVPKAVLRMAPEGEKGNHLLLAARRHFVEDQGEVAERGLARETLFRINRHAADTLEVIAGESLEESVVRLRTEVSRSRGSDGCDFRILSSKR